MKKTYRPTDGGRVGTAGSTTSKITLIGEALGMNEARTGYPFVGYAGETLKNILHQVGLTSQDVYITNVIKEHPPNDDVSSFFRVDNRGKVFVSQTYREYVAELYEELRTTESNIFVPLGNVPLYALTGRIGITKLRGSILEGLAWPGMKVVPTIHPSAANRQYLYTHFIRNDLKRIVEESTSPLIKLPIRQLKLNPTYDEVVAFIANIKNTYQEMACDIEVVNEEMSHISFATSPTKGICIPFIVNGTDKFDPDQEADIIRLITSILEDPYICKVNQNIIFDSSFLFRKYGIRCVNMEDTMIAAGILYPDFPKNLGFLTSMYTREPYYKDDGKKWFKLGSSDNSFQLYNAKDSAVALEVWHKQRAELMYYNNLETYERQRMLIEPLTYMQERGIRMNVEGLKKASIDAGQQIEQLTKEFHDLCGEAINPNSPQQLMNLFYVKKGIKPYVGKGGKPTTDITALKRLARSGIREAVILQKIRKLAKLKGTYLDVTLSKDGRLRSSMNPIGTKTGRLSSSEDIFGEGTNIQNQPKIMRKFMLADQNCVFYNIDLSQAENRIVAYIAPEPLMINAFENGRDMHRQTAALILGIPFDEVSDEDGSCNLGTGEHSQRFWGKKTNHSLNYDLGYKTFALNCEMPEREARIIVERFHKIYPGIRQYHAWVRTKLAKDRTITNLFGRNRVFLDRWGDKLFKEAYAQIPQSSVADKINRQGLLFIYYNQDKFSEVEVLMQVHDSLIIQISLDVPWTRHASILQQIVSSLETPLKWHGIEFSIPVDVKIGLDLKDMKGVRDGQTFGGLARQLSSIYDELGASSELSIMDRDLSDISLSSEEVLSSMGGI